MAVNDSANTEKARGVNQESASGTPQTASTASETLVIIGFPVRALRDAGDAVGVVVLPA
jgi:hypothetical protein